MQSFLEFCGHLKRMCILLSLALEFPKRLLPLSAYQVLQVFYFLVDILCNCSTFTISKMVFRVVVPHPWVEEIELNGLQTQKVGNEVGSREKRMLNMIKIHCVHAWNSQRKNRNETFKSSTTISGYFLIWPTILRCFSSCILRLCFHVHTCSSSHSFFKGLFIWHGCELASFLSHCFQAIYSFQLTASVL